MSASSDPEPAMRFFFLIFAAFALPAAADMSGGDVYDSTCRECHADGKLNAPKLGDRERWKKLIREGLDDIIPEALHGIREMPAKGGNPALSDLEVARAVIFMANASGARFAEPTPAKVKQWRKKADAKPR
ncbi:MAG: c-type cytochrome [Azonexus sp.]|nr:c-type cytochrome [Azonexus sp.]MDZ4313335.1 c-type cytochrome [Azonexus sp.]